MFNLWEYVPDGRILDMRVKTFRNDGLGAIHKDYKARTEKNERG